MRYRIHHRTTYAYASPVFESFNEIRLQPAAAVEQTLLDFELAIEPPATVIVFRDYYGNAVHDFGVPYLHDRLTIEATSDVVTHAAEDEPLAGPAGPGDDASPPLAALARDEALADELAEFLGPSSYIALDGAAAELGRALSEGGDGETALGFLMRAGAAVRARLTYLLGTTTVESSVDEVLAGGSGVCQDFAHVLIALCRHAGLPARYVSGYLGTVPEASASHAWVEGYVPPYGWLGVDPVNASRCTGTYVKLGVGRDYADVSVLRGTYQGHGSVELDVAVQSERVADSSVVAAPGGEGRRSDPLVSIQNLGAMRRFRRGQLLEQRASGTPAALALDEPFTPRRQRRLELDVPMQQPRQQQQRGATRCSSA